MRYIHLDLAESDKQRRKDREDGKPEAATAICGDKELLLFILVNSPNVAEGADLVKFARIERTISALDDPCWLSLNDDDWQWLKTKINHSGYGKMIRTPDGNEQPMYPPAMKRMMGTLMGKLEEATNTMPEDLAEIVKLQEAKKAKTTKSA